MHTAILPWQVRAFLAAALAAPTVIFGKVGVESLNPDFVILIRTAMVLGVVAAIGSVLVATRL